jgi:hypothetical protein
MRGKIDESLGFLIGLGCSDPNDIQDVLDSVEFTKSFFSDLVSIKNDFLNELSRALHQNYGGFIVYESKPSNVNHFLFLNKAKGRDIVSSIKDIPINTLFSVTLTKSIVDMVEQNVHGLDDLEQLEINSRNGDHYSYFLNDVIKSVGQNKTQSKLSLNNKKEIIDFLLSVALTEREKNKIPNVICANAVLSAHAMEPDITTQWVSANISRFSVDPALLKIVVSGISEHFRTKKSLLFSIFKDAIEQT